MNESIVCEYDLPQPPAKVWRALTEPKLLAAWLMENDIAPIVGHTFTFRAPPMPNWDGIVRCEVLEVAHERKLAYSWRGGNIDTVVTWTLAAAPNGGTRLLLEHTGFTPADAMAFDGLSKGWRGERMRTKLADVAARA